MDHARAKTRMHRRAWPCDRDRRGATLLELALVLPLLVTIALGAVDFGRFAHYYITVTKAAGAGAQFGAFHPFTPATQGTWVAGVRQAAVDEMQGVVQYDAEKLTVPDPVVMLETGNFRRVRVEVQYTFETAVAWPLIPGSVVLTRAVEARVVR